MKEREIPPLDREKYWKELTSDEKLDRMRIVVKHLQTQLNAAQEMIERQSRHVHSANEIYFRESRLAGVVERTGLRRRSTDDEVYF